MLSCVVVRFKNGQGNTLGGGNYRMHENGTLEIITARKEDQGTYTCVATNILGKAEIQVRLEVKGKMAGIFTKKPASFIYSRTMDSQFSFKVNGAIFELLSLQSNMNVICLYQEKQYSIL